MTLTFYCYRDSRGEWRWNLKADNGNKIADSGEGYINKADCLRGIELVKSSANADVVQIVGVNGGVRGA